MSDIAALAVGYLITGARSVSCGTGKTSAGKPPDTA